MGEISGDLIPEGALRPLHLVVPAYNPGPDLQHFLPELLAALHATGAAHVVQVVNDGSSEGEGVAIVTLCRRLALDYPAVAPVITQVTNRGKGSAISVGWSLADRGDLLGFVDADGSVSADEVVRLWSEWEREPGPAQVVIASRKSQPGRRVRREWYRLGMARVFNLWVRMRTGLRLHDTQCGCKLVAEELYRRARPYLQEERFSFDVELLLFLERAGARIVEIPVHWHAAKRSTVSLSRDVPAMIRGVAAIAQRAHSWPVNVSH